MFDARQPSTYLVGTGATTSLGSTGYTSSLYTVFLEPGEVRYLYATITTATVSTGNIIVDCYYRPTIGSTSGQVKIGTLTIPTAQAASTTVYKAVTPYVVPAGGTVLFNVATAYAGGGGAGSAILSFSATYASEVPANDSAFTASA